MPMQKSFSQRLAALEALEAEAERHRAQAVATGYALRLCTACGNSSRDRDWTDACPECGATLGSALFRCAICGNEHDRLARLPSPWNVIGACPSCQFSPPPGDSADDAMWARWYTSVGEPFNLMRLIMLLNADVLGVRAFDVRWDLRYIDNRQAAHCCTIPGDTGRIVGHDWRWGWSSLLHTTLDAEQQRTGEPFCQSNADAVAMLGRILIRIPFEPLTLEEFHGT